MERQSRQSPEQVQLNPLMNPFENSKMHELKVQFLQGLGLGDVDHHRIDDGGSHYFYSIGFPREGQVPVIVRRVGERCDSWYAGAVPVGSEDAAVADYEQLIDRIDMSVTMRHQDDIYDVFRGLFRHSRHQDSERLQDAETRLVNRIRVWIR